MVLLELRDRKNTQSLLSCMIISLDLLQDLLQEIGGHDTIGIDRDVTEKMEARAKRFNLQAAGSNIHYEDMVELYKR